MDKVGKVNFPNFSYIFNTVETQYTVSLQPRVNIHILI